MQGGEEHQKRLLPERLRAQILGDGDEFNCDLLDVKERWEGIADSAEQAKRDRQPTRTDKIITMAQALPFLGNGRLVMVRNIDLLPVEQQKKLAKSLTTIPPMNHLLLVTSEMETGKKDVKLSADLQKAIEKTGVIYDCSTLTDDEAMQWVRETLVEWGQKIEANALRLLVSRAGTELRRLQIEVEKLSLMIGAATTIRLADVELMTPRLAEESVFRLTDAVAARNAARAMTILRELLEEQLEPPVLVFAMLIRQFRLLWQVKILVDSGWNGRDNPSTCTKALAILPEQNLVVKAQAWMLNKLASPARQMSWTQLSFAYQALLECDMAGKGIEGVPRQELDQALELLCARLCMQC